MIHSWSAAARQFPGNTFCSSGQMPHSRCSRHRERILTCSLCASNRFQKEGFVRRPYGVRDCRLPFMPSLMEICWDLLRFTHGFGFRGVPIEKRQRAVALKANGQQRALRWNWSCRSQRFPPLAPPVAMNLSAKLHRPNPTPGYSVCH